MALRRFINGIEMLDEHGQVIPTVFGLPTYVNFDEAFDIIAETLAGSHHAGLNFENAMYELSQRAISIPWLQTVVDRLQQDTAEMEEMRNKFMYTMTRHRLSMQFVMFGKDSGGHFARVYDTNSAEVSQNIEKQWQNMLRKSDLVLPGTSHINKRQAKVLLDEYQDGQGNVILKNKTDAEIVAWLAKVGVVITEQTLKDIRSRGILNSKGDPIHFDTMWGEASKSSKSAGLFDGIAHALHRYSNTPADENINIDETDRNRPTGDINNTIKTLAKMEAVYSNTKVSTSFRAGGKSVSGIIQTSFGTDRLGHLTSLFDEDSGVVEQLFKDPYSRNSSLLRLIQAHPNELKQQIRINHTSLDALKEKGKGNNEDNAVTNLSNHVRYTWYVYVKGPYL